MEERQNFPMNLFTSGEQSAGGWVCVHDGKGITAPSIGWVVREIAMDCADGKAGELVDFQTNFTREVEEACWHGRAWLDGGLFFRICL